MVIYLLVVDEVVELSWAEPVRWARALLTPSTNRTGPQPALRALRAEKTTALLCVLALHYIFIDSFPFKERL